MMLVTEYCSFGNLLNFLRDEWKFLHQLQLRKQSLNRNIADLEFKQEQTKSGQDSNTASFDKVKHNNLPHADAETVNENNEVVQRFKIKYHEIDMTKSTTNEINNYNNNNNNKLLPKINSQHVEDINETDNTTITTPPRKELLKDTSSPTSTTSVLFRTAENKSYGYHGHCTNSCKCDVDVIIKNIDSTDTMKQNEELERVLEQRHLEQQESYRNKICGNTTIEIKNCDCKKYKNSRNFKGPIENKSYFTISSPQYEQLVKNKINGKTPNKSINDLKNDKLPEKSRINRVPLSNGDLLDIARQVAVGMEFLSKNKVVHRDLAARNVLVAPDRTVKIADFGLSRDVYQDNMYKKTGNGKLPIKWLALESMTHQMYTTKSDVWSYGILLYEIVTLGATPYPSISTNRLLHLLKSGYRMEKPKGCSQEIYDLMYSCWNAEPIERPTFTDIVQKLDEMLKIISNSKDSPTMYTEINNDSSTHNQSIENIPSDDSYLNPL